jgi:hypothetical protein
MEEEWWRNERERVRDERNFLRRNIYNYCFREDAN